MYLSTGSKATNHAYSCRCPHVKAALQRCGDGPTARHHLTASPSTTSVNRRPRTSQKWP